MANPRRGDPPKELDFISHIGPNADLGRVTPLLRSPQEPLFEVESPHRENPCFSLRLGCDEPLEAFLDTNGYGTNNAPYIGIRAARNRMPPLTPHYTARRGRLQGFGALPGESGEGQIVDAACIAYVTGGELKIYAIYYRKGANPIKRKIEPGKLKDDNQQNPEIVGIVNALWQSRGNFLAENSGIPPRLVDRCIRPVYAKLEELLPPSYVTPEAQVREKQPTGTG